MSDSSYDEFYRGTNENPRVYHVWNWPGEDGEDLWCVQNMETQRIEMSFLTRIAAQNYVNKKLQETQKAKN